MSDWDRQMWKRREQAQDLVKVAKFIPNGTTYCGLKRYDVMVGPAKLGQVEQVKCTSHRMAGRLVARTFHMVEWEPVKLPGDRYTGLTYRTRKEAAQAMAERFLLP